MQQHHQRPVRITLVLVVHVESAGNIHEVRRGVRVFSFQGFIGNVGAAQLQPRAQQRQDENAGNDAEYFQHFIPPGICS
jgi:hypothetical protein